MMSVGVALTGPTSYVVTNGGPDTGGSAVPFTVNTTVATPSAAVVRASSVTRLFSITVAPLGLVRLRRPVVKPNDSGAVSGDPSAATSALPDASVMAFDTC